jgi:hypothetical protein
MGNGTAFGLAGAVVVVLVADALWLDGALRLMALRLLDRTIEALAIWR